MSEEQHGRTVESEVRGVISAFEQILEAVPNDRAALEAVAHGYEQLGDRDQALQAYKALARVLLDEGDTDAARELRPTLETLSDGGEELVALLDEIGEADIAEIAPPEPGDQPPVRLTLRDAPPSVDLTFAMADELSMAWNLREAGELSEEEYASVVQDLTEMSASDDGGTISVLHVLEHRSAGGTFKGLERVLAFVSKDCGTPTINLSSFDLDAGPVSLVPLDAVRRCGLLVFELVGDDALVVILNPYNERMRKDVAAYCERRCHFFLCLPSEFDGAVNRIPEILEADTE